jgi:hypothetical protein
MGRKSIFELVDENYNIQDEIKKINNIFINYRNIKMYSHNFSLKELVGTLFFKDWKYRGTCLDLDEFIKKANATINLTKNSYNDEEHIINSLELIENCCALFNKNYTDLFNNGMTIINDTQKILLNLIDTAEKNLGLCIKKIDEKIILYPKNAPLEHIIKNIEKTDVQWELINYTRTKMSLEEKRKSLAYLATNLYIEKDENETKIINDTINEITNILNTIHIRHNNKTGKWKKEVLDNLTEKELLKLCDYAYSKMLSVVLLREQKSFEEVYIEFNKKQKEISKK